MIDAFEFDCVELYCDDAFRFLQNCKKQSFHAIVTDPPFGVVEYSNTELAKLRSGSGGLWRIPNRIGGAERAPAPRFTVLGAAEHAAIAAFHTTLADLMFDVLVPGAHVAVASQALLLDLVTPAYRNCGFEPRGIVCRIVKTLRGGDRPKGSGKRHAHVSVIPRGCWEPWLLFRKPCEGIVSANLDKYGTGGLHRNGQGPFRDIIESGVASRAERLAAPHPSLKPQGFLRELVRAVIPLDHGTVLDPFAGSGSTLAAAASLGICAVGIEKDRRYFNLAIKAIPILANMEDSDP